eukprot:4498714-Prymnesium_polylepis.1
MAAILTPCVREATLSHCLRPHTALALRHCSRTLGPPRDADRAHAHGSSHQADELDSELEAEDDGDDLDVTADGAESDAVAA